MKTLDLRRQDGRLVAFEIGKTFVPMAGIRRVLAKIPGLAFEPLNTTDEIKLRFTLNNHEFQVWEPWADRSRYWIGPVELDSDSLDKSETVEIIRSEFRQTPWIALFLARSR